MLEGRLELALGAGLLNDQLLPESTSCRLHLWKPRAELGVTWIAEDGDDFCLGYQLAQYFHPLGIELAPSKKGHTGDIAAGAAETGDQTRAHRVLAGNKYKRGTCACISGSFDRRLVTDNNRDTSPQKIGRKRRQLVEMIVRPALLDHNVSTLGEPFFAQSFAEGRNEIGKWLGWCAAKKADHRHRSLLRARYDRPRRHTTERT